MKPALILGIVALLLIAWLLRYDISGSIQAGNSKAPILLDRWTGNTYLYRGGEWEKIETSKWERAPDAKK